MPTKYIGVMQVEAAPYEQDGKVGYLVEYADGSVFWMQASVFYRTFFSLSAPGGDTLTENDITRFFDKFESQKMGEKTLVTQATMINGFSMVTDASCVDPKNYDEEIGSKICLERLRNKTWELMGFVLQWARSGIKPEENHLEF
ncbi:hypothetical protein LLG39_08835 [bacterium]|nr:hypothetical protein [bacterium]